MNTHRPIYDRIEKAVQISMSLPGAFKPVYVDTPVRGDDTMQNTKYQGLFIDGGMLNNYPIHAFDHIEYTGSPTPGAAFLSGITYRGLRGDYPIAGDPKLRQGDCDCVLGMRLQDKEENLQDLDEKKLYPSDEIVLGSFLKDLLFTYMAYSEESQIRSVSDMERTVEFYATVKEDYEGFGKLKYKLKLDKDEKEYSLSVMDFSSPAVDRTSERRHEYLAKVKEKLMDDASKKMTEFLKK